MFKKNQICAKRYMIQRYEWFMNVYNNKGCRWSKYQSNWILLNSRVLKVLEVVSGSPKKLLLISALHLQDSNIWISTQTYEIKYLLVLLLFSVFHKLWLSYHFFFRLFVLPQGNNTKVLEYKTLMSIYLISLNFAFL